MLQALLFPPIAIPWLITGTAMLIFFFGVGIGRGLHAILLGHVALALPYVIVVVSARLQTFAPELEEAARSLGASQWQVTMRVTLPWIMPGVIAGALFAFAVSFDQFVVSYFLSTPGEATLPVEIYAAIRKGFTPEINAVSTIIIAVSMGADARHGALLQVRGRKVMAEVQVEKVSRSFGAHKALDDVSIDFPDGGFYALLGPSGSGKTTLLRMIAGFDFPDAGSIRIGGEGVERVPVEKRRIGMVFQSYALFPNMSVADNVAFGLSVRGEPKSEIAGAVQNALDLVQLGKLGERRPHQLSGGQRQRVALARAIVIKPRVLLLDEPLGALDKALRVDMQIELKRIQREIGITTIFVTHDQEEALTMSDRIGILRDGRLVQEGPPEEIYDSPKSEFAATFLGDANILRGDATDEWHPPA